MVNTLMFFLPLDQDIMAQSFLLLSQIISGNIVLIANIMTCDNAYRSEEDDQSGLLTLAELNDQRRNFEKSLLGKIWAFC